MSNPNYHRDYYHRTKEERKEKIAANTKRQNERCKADPVCLEKKRKSMREGYHKLRNKFLDMYGRQCSCCGEDAEEFLTLDHIRGQHGKKNEPSTTAYRKAIDKYDPKTYRTLCQNCNHSYGVRGYSPRCRS